MNKALRINTVSVIMPCFNSNRTLRASADSVLQQSYRNLELIVIDNGSTDGTVDTAKELVARDPRVRLLHCTTRGAANARNCGLDAATGRFIAFLDSDDLWHREKLDVQIEFMLSRQVAACCTSYRVIFADGRESTRTRRVPAVIDRSRLLKTCDIGCLTFVYDKDAIGDIRMPVIAKEDYAFWFLIVDRCGVIHGIDDLLATYRLSDQSISGSKLKEPARQWAVYRDFLRLPLLTAAMHLVIYIGYALLNRRDALPFRQPARR